ncbi:uncharacterized protein LOC143478232 [Brachyhypopomus gauderio]|uniref:uncharacterized protein LOC143478232 n=1 Tax=Brachyhypopomus gauderio TaxID=698409 RepID=UPI0040435833
MENLGQPILDLWDPYMHLTDWNYSNLDDADLTGFFSQPYKHRILIKHGLITPDEKVLCSEMEFRRFKRYVKIVEESWEKLFVQKQKQSLKEFMLKVLRGEVPDGVTVYDMKKWLINNERKTFRKMYIHFMKWSDPQSAELAWELNQQFQLEALEKEVIRELRLEGHDQRHLEDLRRSGSSRPLLMTTVSSILSYYERNSESAEEASSLVITGENLHNLTRRVTSLVGEIKESLVPVLPALLHCTASVGTDELSQCTIDGSDSTSLAQLISENCETVLRVVEISTIKIIMETFRVSRSSPEPARVLQEFYSVLSTHPQRQFLLWLRSSIIETVMGQLFFPQKVIDVRDAGSLGKTEVSTPAMPKMESTPVGSKHNKVKKVHGFFRRAWQALKKTFCFGK